MVGTLVFSNWFVSPFIVWIWANCLETDLTVSDQTPACLSLVSINMCKSRAIVISTHNLNSAPFAILNVNSQQQSGSSNQIVKIGVGGGGGGGGGEANIRRLGPVVQSIVSLTSSLVVEMLSGLVKTISKSQVFLLKKCE